MFTFSSVSLSHEDINISLVLIIIRHETAIVDICIDIRLVLDHSYGISTDVKLSFVAGPKREKFKIVHQETHGGNQILRSNCL